MSWLYLKPPSDTFCDQDEAARNRCMIYRPGMAISSEYVFVSIQLAVALISLGGLVPCVVALVRTATMHGNCKALLVVSSLCSIWLLLTQISVFIYDIATDNLAPVSDESERWFLIFHNIFYVTTSCLSLFIVLERFYAIHNPAAYERQSVDYYFILIASLFSTLYAIAIVYCIYTYRWYLKTIFSQYVIEVTVIIISCALYFYSQRRLRDLPYTSDRLSAKYQVVEIFEFSRAIVPAVSLSALLRSASLIPTMFWKADVISYVVCCLFYFTIHAINCLAMKITLFACHRVLLRNIQRILCASGRVTPEPAPVSDKESDTKLYFSQIQASWNE